MSKVTRLGYFSKHGIRRYQALWTNEFCNTGGSFLQQPHVKEKHICITSGRLNTLAQIVQEKHDGNWRRSISEPYTGRVFRTIYYARRLATSHFTKWPTFNIEKPSWLFQQQQKQLKRCSKCTDRLEQERLKRLARTPGADRATRMDDMSSDEDDVGSGGVKEEVACILIQK